MANFHTFTNKELDILYTCATGRMAYHMSREGYINCLNKVVPPDCDTCQDTGMVESFTYGYNPDGYKWQDIEKTDCPRCG